MREREHQEAVVLMRRVGFETLNWPQLKWLHHIPNGGFRNKATAGKLKAEGVKAGVADYFLPWPMGFSQTVYHGLYLELKSQDGYPTEAQKQFLMDMREAGYAATWVRGADAAWAALRAYLQGEEIPYDWRQYEAAHSAQAIV